MNPFDLEPLTLLSEFGNISKAETWNLWGLNPNDEREVKEVIRLYILPQVNGWDKTTPGFRDRLKVSLQDLLAMRISQPLSDIFERGEPPFTLPDNPIDYYQWAWDVIFSN